jgi:hypothetical protein
MNHEDGLVGILVPADGALRELMTNYLQRRPERAGRKAWFAVGQAKPGGEWLTTFSPETATRRRDIDFLTLQHPLVGALLDDEPDVVRPVAALRVRADGIAAGAYAFFLYLLNVHSFRSSLEFLPVVVPLGGGDVESEASARLLSLIRSANGEDASAVQPDESDVEGARRTADEFVAGNIREREAALAALSDQIIDRRISSLSESFERWLEHRRELLAQAEWNEQESIARLHRGYIRRREVELATKLRDLDAQRTIVIGQDLVAGGILEVESPS